MSLRTRVSTCVAGVEHKACSSTGRPGRCRKLPHTRDHNSQRHTSNTSCRAASNDAHEFQSSDSHTTEGEVAAGAGIDTGNAYPHCEILRDMASRVDLPPPSTHSISLVSSDIDALEATTQKEAEDQQLDSAPVAIDLKQVWESLQLVQAQLKVAVSEEDYRAAARLKKDVEALEQQLSPIQQYLMGKVEQLRSGSQQQRLEAVQSLWEACCSTMVPGYLTQLAAEAVVAMFPPTRDPQVASITAEFSSCVFDPQRDEIDVFGLFKTMSRLEPERAMLMGTILRARIEKSSGEGGGEFGGAFDVENGGTGGTAVRDEPPSRAVLGFMGLDPKSESEMEGLMIDLMRIARESMGKEAGPSPRSFSDLPASSFSGAGDSSGSSSDSASSGIGGRGGELASDLARQIEAGSSGVSSSGPNLPPELYQQLLLGTRQEQVAAVTTLWKATSARAQPLPADFSALARASLLSIFQQPTTEDSAHLLTSFVDIIMDPAQPDSDAMGLYFRLAETPDLHNSILVGEIICAKSGILLPPSVTNRRSTLPQAQVEAPQPEQAQSKPAATGSAATPGLNSGGSMGSLLEGMLQGMAGFMKSLLGAGGQQAGQQQQHQQQQQEGGAAQHAVVLKDEGQAAVAVAVDFAAMEERRRSHEAAAAGVADGGGEASSRRGERLQVLLVEVFEEMDEELVVEGRELASVLMQLVENSMDEMRLQEVPPELVRFVKLMQVMQGLLASAAEQQVQGAEDGAPAAVARRKLPAEDRANLQDIDALQALRFADQLAAVRDGDAEQKLAAVAKLFGVACRGEMPPDVTASAVEAVVGMFPANKKKELQMLVSDFAMVLFDPMRAVDEAIAHYEVAARTDPETAYVMGALLEAVLESHLQQVEAADSASQIEDLLSQRARGSSAAAAAAAAASAASRSKARRSQRSGPQRKRRLRRRRSEDDATPDEQ